jgi:hypothetical protein
MKTDNKQTIVKPGESAERFIFNSDGIVVIKPSNIPKTKS